MAESADALDSGSSRGQLGGGSSPLIRTKKKTSQKWLVFSFVIAQKSRHNAVFQRSSI